MLFLLIDVMTLSDLDFVCNDKILFLILFCQGLVFLLFKQLNLRFGIELINFNPSNFIQQILKLHFLFLNIDRNFVSLFQQVSSCLLDRCMFTLLIDKVFIDFFRFLMEFHNIVLDQVHIALNWFLFLLCHFDILFSSRKRFFQHHQLRRNLFFLLKKLCSFCLQRSLYFCNVVSLNS